MKATPVKVDYVIDQRRIPLIRPMKFESYVSFRIDMPPSDATYASDADLCERRAAEIQQAVNQFDAHRKLVEVVKGITNGFVHSTPVERLGAMNLLRAALRAVEEAGK